MQQPPRPGMNGQASGQPGTVSVDMSVNSSMPSVVHNQGQNTPVQGAESAMPMPPNVQVGDMRPPAVQMPAQKSVATVAPRVVLSSNAVTTRPVQPITLQILQSLQSSQQVHFLLKTVNGQYQLLTVRPASGMNSLVHPVHTQGIRRSSVPALAGGVATVATNTLISIGHQLQHMQQQHLQQQQLQQQQLQQQRQQQQLQQHRQQQQLQQQQREQQQRAQQQREQQQREQQQREQQQREQQQREQQQREQQQREQQQREQQKREQQKREQLKREQQQREQQQREQQQREQQQREQQQREQQKREQQQREQQQRQQRQLQQMQQLQQQQMQQQQTQQQQMQQPKMPQPMSITVASVSIAIEQPVHRTSQVTKSVTAGDVTKEKCRIFLGNLLDMSRKEPRNMEWDVRCLIQELIDDRVGPKQFCIRLERMLSAIPQPCLVGFLKKSLPLVRKAMLLQELAIEGINPPPYRVAFPMQPMGNLEIMPMAPPPGAVPVSNALMVTPQQPVPKPGGMTALLNIPKVTQVKLERNTMSVNKSVPRSSTSIANASGKSVHKDKERNVFPSSVTDDKMAGDDDINDVAAMGGVNLQEETQRILGNTDLIGSQIRSCKEDYLVPPQALMARIKARCAARGLEEPSAEVAQLFAHALNERMKSLIEKLICSSQNRIETDCKMDKRYEVTQDVRGQLKFLEELDHVEKKRQEESEREMLLRAAKSRSKNEDPEQAKLKAKAKEMQRVELEELRQREANLTALQAIGARKKPRLESTAPASAVPQGSRGQMAMRPRTKRITLRDMLHMLESDRHYCRSVILYKAYLKS